jgi:hypothetical protein
MYYQISFNQHVMILMTSIILITFLCDDDMFMEEKSIGFIISLRISNGNHQ